MIRKAATKKRMSFATLLLDFSKTSLSWQTYKVLFEHFSFKSLFQTKIYFKNRRFFSSTLCFSILNFLSFRHRSCYSKAVSFRYTSLFQMLIYFFFKFQKCLLATTVQKQFWFRFKTLVVFKLFKKSFSSFTLYLFSLF